MACLSALALEARAAEPWSVLVLIYPNTGVFYPDPDVGPNHFVGSAEDPATPEDEVALLRAAAENFGQIVASWSDGLVSVKLDIEVIANPLYSVSSMNVPPPEPQEYWPQPPDVKDELRQFLPRGYDSVIVVWYKGDANSSDPDDKVPFGSFGAALVSPEQFEGKQFTWSTVSVERSDFSQSNPGAGFAANVQDPGEALLHEWLHSIGGWGFYGQNGYQLPDADESDFYDAASDADYADTSPGVGGFEAFYRDLLRGRIVAQLPGSPIPEQFGLSPGVWEYGTLRAHGFPAPAQLRSPIDGACVTTTPTLRWVSPNVLGSEFYEVLIYAEGDLANPILIGTTNNIQFQVGGGLVDGETYFWRVRPLSQSGTPPTGDLLRFHVASQVEAPIIVPDGGGLHAEGGLVSVGLASSSAEIHYTTTGTDPTRTDAAVQPGEEFLVVPPAFVKARAWRTGCNPSPVTTRFFSAFSQARIVTNTNDSGDGSLRKAILDANASPGSELIRFDIPGGGVHTIAPASNLPDITDPVVIDATTQPGWTSLPLIELRGQALVTRGFRILAGSSVISGFAINGFASHGIQIEQSGGNNVYSCFIGTNAAGSAALANQGSGIYIDGSQFNSIGGTTAAQRNVISGNRIRGIEIRNPGSRLNYVQGNYIGTDRTGTSAIPNAFGGVLIVDASENQIGGTTAGERNLISGNGFSGNSGDGVGIANGLATKNVVEGNYIGTNAAGTGDLGNSRSGVIVSAIEGVTSFASNNRIGGVEPGARNVISGNDEHGVAILGGAIGGVGNAVQGNYIGTDFSGSFDLGNSFAGVAIARTTPTPPPSSGNAIGGVVPEARNLISGNGTDGITITGAGGNGNVIQGNYIGTDATGIFDVGNSRSGVRLTTVGGVFSDSAANNTIGGSTFGAGNLISGNDQNGVAVIGNSIGGSSNKILGNRIGVNAAADAALGNGDGVWITTTIAGGTASNNQVGGSGVGAGNTIGGNTLSGVRIEGSGATGNFVQSNRIGVNALGAPIANGGAGLTIGSSGNVIGAPGNTIAFNGNAGVFVTSGSGNRILQNSLDLNGGPGIDLSSPLQLSPQLDGAIASVATVIAGAAPASASDLTLEFFSSPLCDPSGFGEGKRYLGEAVIPPESPEFQIVAPAVVPVGHVITATATDAAGNTSELSACIAVDVGPPDDPDGDGWTTPGGDNCPYVPNPGAIQPDSGRVGSTLPDGIGDVCQCGDVFEDGLVDADDLDLYRDHLASPGGSAFLGGVPAKCSVVGSDPSGCDILDVVVMRRALAGSGPGIGQACSAAGS